MAQEIRIEDYWLILKRRKWWLILPAVIVGLLAGGISFLLPNEYRSETTILVQQQQIPKDFVKPTVSTDLQDRLQSMTQEILSRTRLEMIITKFSLFRQPQSKLALLEQRVRKVGARLGVMSAETPARDMSELVQKMRANISVQLIQRPRDPEVTAFKVAYIAETPQLAQAVTSELTNLFINENLKAREQMAESTTDFIDTELETARKALDQQEAGLKDFKSKYMGELPQEQQTNLNLLNQAQAQSQANLDQINQYRQQDTYLKNIIAQREALSQAGGDTSQSPTALQNQLAALQAKKADLETHYTAEHPDVIEVKAEIARVEQQLKLNAANVKDPSSASKNSRSTLLAADPALLQAKTQQEANQLALERRLKQQEQIEAAIRQYQDRVRLSPLREQQYSELTRDYGIAKGNYESLLEKRHVSEMAANLEKRQQGEQFVVLDPASLPMTPFRPHRALISLGGVFGGLLFGVVIVVAGEAVNKTIRTEREAEAQLQLPVLAVLPLVADGTTGMHSRHRRRSKQQVTSIMQS